MWIKCKTVHGLFKLPQCAITFGTIFIISCHAYAPTRRPGSPSDGAISHSSITKDALYRVTATLFNDIPIAGISLPIRTDVIVLPEEMFRLYYGNRTSTINYINAVDEIQAANVDIDLQSTTKVDPTWHFDAEKIVLTNNRLKSLRRGIYQAAINGDYAHARLLTGQFLHPLQDFYSHSNWVEMGQEQINFALGVEGANIGEVAAEEKATCRDCQVVSLTYPRTYDCRQGNLLPDLRRDKILTTGYKSGQRFNGQTVIKPPNKCSHGGLYDETELISPVGGINKDTKIPSISSHYELLEAGQRHAVDATVHFLNGLRESLGNKRFSEFLNIRRGRSLVIVMDTTFSMDPYIEAAKERCYELVAAARNDSSSAIKDYVLVPFNDPGYGPAFQTEDPDAFIASIQRLFPYDGGDLPEMSFSGILMAARISSENSPIFVFTDASAKDVALQSVLVAVLLERKQTVYIIGENVATFPEYLTVTQLTGGQVLATDDTESNIFSISAIMDGNIKSNSNLMLILDNVPELTRTITLAVDSLTDKFDVLLKHPESVPMFEVVVSGNAQKRATAAYELVIDTQTTKLFRFTKPASGQWSFNVAGSKPGWSAEIKGSSFFDVSYNLQYFEDSTTDYPGFRVLKANPLIGENITLSVTSTCDKCLLKEVAFLKASGVVLESLLLTYIAESHEYVSSFIVPAETFYVQVSGQDENGVAFQRLQGNQVTPTELRMTFTNGETAVEEMIPGERRQINFTITNEAGRVVSMQLSVDDSLKFATFFQPSHSLQIESNASVPGFVAISVPINVEPGTISDLVISVAITDSVHNANFFRKKITVVSATPDTEPPVCTIVSSTFESLCTTGPSDCANHFWSVNMTFYDAASGIDRVFVNATGQDRVTWTGHNLTEFIPANVSVAVDAAGSCCVQAVSVTLVDRSGLNGRCVFKRAEIIESGLSAGEIAGIICGVLAALLLIIGVVVYFKKRSKK